MKKMLTWAWTATMWVLTVFMGAVAIMYFPSKASIIAIVFVVIAAPIKGLQDFLAKLGMKKALKAAVLCVAFIASMATAPTESKSTADETTRGTLPSKAVTQEAEMPSGAPEQAKAVEPTATPSPTAKPTPEPTATPTPPQPVTHTTMHTEAPKPTQKPTPAPVATFKPTPTPQKEEATPERVSDTPTPMAAASQTPAPSKTPEPVPLDQGAGSTVDVGQEEEYGGNGSNVQSSGGSGGGGNADNFNTWDNESQQQTADNWVLNINTMKIHYPSCSQVKRIAPQNYATSNKTESELISEGYTTCKVCH